VLQCVANISAICQFKFRCFAVYCIVLQCAAMCWKCVLVCCSCSVLQCLAVCCSILQCTTAICQCKAGCVAVSCSALQCVAECCTAVCCCTVLQCVLSICHYSARMYTRAPFTKARCCSVLQCIAVCGSVLQCVACVAVCCSVLQCIHPHLSQRHPNSPHSPLQSDSHRNPPLPPPQNPLPVAEKILNFPKRGTFVPWES